MRPLRALALPALATTLGCVLDLDVPEEAQISCASQADCPEGLVCSATLDRCIRASGKQPPSITVGLVARSDSTVTIPVRVVDPDDEEVTLIVEVVHDGSAVPIEVTPSTLRATAEGVDQELTWNALEHFGDAAYRSGLVLRLAAQDDVDRGPTITSEPFTFGNDAPRLVGLGIDGDADGVVRGVARVHFTVDDVDPSRINLFEIVVGGETLVVDTTSTASFPNGVPAALDGNVPVILSWQTGVAAPRGRSDALLRVGVSDLPLGRASSVAETSFVIDNSPSLSIAAAPAQGRRGLATTSLTFTVSDPNGPPAGTETVTVQFSYSVDGTTWSPATPAASSDQLEPVATFGTPLLFVWDAVADADADPLLDATDVVTAANGSTTATVLAYAPAVWLRAQAVDSTGLASAVQALPEPLALGDEPPSVTLDELPADVRGEVTLGFFIEDTSADAVDVELQFALAGETFWRRAAVSRGSLVALSSSPLTPGEEHLVTWDSRAPLDVDADTAQGIGSQTLAGVRLRVRGSNEPDGSTRIYGDWSELALGSVTNQTAPQVLDVELGRLAYSSGSSAVAIHYRLTDEERDPADVLVEYNAGLGTAWLPCREYPLAQSEGRYDLATAPALPGRGVPHTFVWDPTGVRLAEPNLTYIRITARDAAGASTTEVLAAHSVGPSLEPPNDSPFTAPAQYGQALNTGDGAWDTELADFNGDGLLDLAGSNRAEPPEVWVSLASPSGDGTFGPLAFYPAGPGTLGNYVRGMAVDDFDEDGALDLAVTTRDDFDPDYVAVLFGVGDGTFVPPTAGDIYVLDSEPYYLDTADINGDGIVDIVTHQDQDRLVVLLGEGAAGLGDGTFAAPVLASGVGNFRSPTVLELADLTGDGELDVLLDAFGTITIWPGDGTGDFGNPTRVGPASISRVQPHDLDHDGDLDLVATRGSPVTIVVLWSDGAGGFVTGAESTLGLVAQELRLADVSGDGIDDFVSTAPSSAGGLLVALGLGDAAGPLGLFSAPMTVPLGYFANRLHVHDVDGDARLDLIAGHLTGPGPHFSVVKGRASGGTGPTAFSPAAAFPLRGYRGLRFGDFDRDGIADAVAGGNLDSVLTFGQGRGGIGNGALLSTGGAIVRGGQPVAADLNADGLLDLAVGGSLVEVRLGQGDGSFAPSEYYSPGSGTGSATHLADVNGDGGLDLVIGGHLSVRVMENVLDAGVPTGTFAQGALLSLQYNTSDGSILVADVNNDGAVDILPLTVVGMEVHLNDLNAGQPTGTFTWTGVRYRPGAGIRNGVAADFDDDGVLDVALIDDNWAELSIYRGAGGGSFIGPTMHTLSSNAGFITAGDVDNDGVTDLLVDDGGALRVMLGTSSGGLGDGGFAAPIMLSADVGPTWGALRDLNLDGRLDIVTLHLASTSVTVHTGQLQELFVSEAHWLRPYGSSDPGKVRVVGAHDTATGLDRFGAPRAPPHLAYRPAPVGCGGNAELVDELRQAGLAHGLVPLTRAWQAHGGLMLRRELAPDSLERLRVVDRLGPIVDGVRRGLDVSAPAFADQSGVVLDLPWLEAYTTVDPALVRLYCCSVDYERAATLPSDPLFAYLPANAAGEPVFQTSVQWEPIVADTGGDFPAGVGRRYLLDAAARRVRLLTDRLGICQAFVAP